MIVVLAAFVAAMTPSAEATTDPAKGPARIAVLEFVDLSDNSQKPEVTDLMRRSLSATGKWTILARDSVAKRLGEFNINPHQSCNNPQCSFDIGNVVQAEYVLFGTSSPLVFIQAVTLKLLHIPTAKIVWTKVLEGLPVGKRSVPQASTRHSPPRRRKCPKSSRTWTNPSTERPWRSST